MKKWTLIKVMGLFFGLGALVCLVFAAVWEENALLFRIGMLSLCTANLLLIWDRRHGANDMTDEKGK